MNEIVAICYSPEENFLNRLLTETETYFGNSSVEKGFRNRDELLQHLESLQFRKEIQFILLDISGSDKESSQFLDTVNRLAPNSIKMVIAESSHSVAIHKQINNHDAFHFINRPVSEDDFKIAFTTAKNCYSKLQTVLKYKEKLNHYNIEKEKQFSVLAHDLKSPFTALLGISEILISDWDELSDTDKLELVKGMRSTSENAFQMVEKLLLKQRNQSNNSIL
jgi:hypothetical protein